MRVLLLISGAVALLEVGHRVGLHIGRRQGYALRFCPNCQNFVRERGLITQ